MALIPPTPEIRATQVLADNAYQAHAAMIRAEKQYPPLAHNPAWKALRDTAYARFRAALEKA